MWNLTNWVANPCCGWQGKQPRLLTLHSVCTLWLSSNWHHREPCLSHTSSQCVSHTHHITHHNHCKLIYSQLEVFDLVILLMSHHLSLLRLFFKMITSSVLLQCIYSNESYILEGKELSCHQVPVHTLRTFNFMSDLIRKWKVGRLALY